MKRKYRRNQKDGKFKLKKNWPRFKKGKKIAKARQYAPVVKEILKANARKICGKGMNALMNKLQK